MNDPPKPSASGKPKSLPVAMPTPANEYLAMTSDRPGVAESGRTVPPGTTVVYLAHVPGGMVQIRMPDGTIEIMSPHCFAHLR